MSTLLDLSIFPIGKDVSVGAYVSAVVQMIRSRRLAYRLTAMGTLVETDTIAEALDVVAKAHEVLETMGCERIYAVAKLDSRRGKTGRLEGKIESVRAEIGQVSS
jgi:uncharacterized protein (TIGR00106 family)